jgi:protein TonB
MATRIGLSAGVFTLIAAGAMVTAGSGPQQPRDRTVSQQRSIERAGFDAAIAKLERAAAEQPGDARAQHLVGTFYYQKARDHALGAGERRGYIERGLAAEDRALAADPDFVDALVYKNILLRTRATLEPDPAVRQAIVRDADELRNRALQLAQAQRWKNVPEGAVVDTDVPPPPPPPPPPGGTAEPIRWVYAKTAVSAAAGVPVQTRHVRPIFAPMAIVSGYKGDVVVEASLDSRGRVAQVKVVKSIPLLTQATIDAVRQWEFDPTSLPSGGAAITVTATFTPPLR